MLEIFGKRRQNSTSEFCNGDSLLSYRTRVIFLLLVICLAAPISGQDADAVYTDPVSGARYSVERYTTATYPVSMAFAPDGRLFYTEKNDRQRQHGFRRWASDSVSPSFPYRRSAIAERGMLGITLDPDYLNNGYIWIAHSREATAVDFAEFHIVRFHEQDGRGDDPQIMYALPLENNALIHLGGNLQFDADGALFVSIGNHENPANSQDLDTPTGRNSPVCR